MFVLLTLAFCAAHAQELWASVSAAYAWLRVVR